MTEIQTYGQKQAIVKSALTKAQGAIMAALPKHMDPERMFRIYLTACNTSPLILECEPVSIVGAVMRSAAFGLSLETVTGEAFIIPRRNKQLGGRHAANFQIGYKGLRKLALQGDPELRDMFAYAVYENDVFAFELGLDPKITVHKPAPSGARGKLAQAYAVGVWKDGYRRFEVIDSDVIERAKKFAGGLDKPDSPWNTNEEAMWRKTALRRLSNQLPLSSDIARELARGDGIDGHESLRQQAAEDPRTRALLVDLNAMDLLDVSGGVGSETEQSALDRAAGEVERSLDGDGKPERAPRAPRASRAPRQRRQQPETPPQETPPNGSEDAGSGDPPREPGQEG